MANGFTGFNVTELSAGFVAWSEEIGNQAEEAVDTTVQEAAGNMVGIIYAATTPTGEARLARGGVAGRVDSGDMVQAVKADTSREGNTIIGTWGWLEDFENYFGIQEDGSKNVEGMHALSGSFNQAVNDLSGRLSGIAR